ncbi:MAG TPA: DnaJ domain-containing protein [Candidatus Krumholzibacteriaceae bacterium]|nr:DnaJ domain-containing protein [Candidatus Krumholzibacteriaceae bacterium]
MTKDYYSILELNPMSTKAEIQKNYFSIAKIVHPEVVGDIPDNHRRLKDVNEAYSILSDSQKRREYDESIKSERSSPETDSASIERNKKTAAVAFRKAREAIRKEAYQQAAVLLASAIRHDFSVAAYHSWYGYSLAISNSGFLKAREECKKAVQMDPYNPEFTVNLGVVYFYSGLNKQALTHFMDALKWDPDNKTAKIYIYKIKQGEKRDQKPIERVINFFKINCG